VERQQQELMRLKALQSLRQRREATNRLLRKVH
jgi:hypothetical protein